MLPVQYTPPKQSHGNDYLIPQILTPEKAERSSEVEKLKEFYGMAYNYLR